MSHNHSNFEKQKKGHWGPILGIGAALVFVAVLFFYMQEDALTGDGDSQATEENIETTTE